LREHDLPPATSLGPNIGKSQMNIERFAAIYAGQVNDPRKHGSIGPNDFDRLLDDERVDPESRSRGLVDKLLSALDLSSSIHEPVVACEHLLQKSSVSFDLRPIVFMRRLGEVRR